MSELAYRTLRENVAAEIRTKILNQELAPGTRIVEQNLSKEFGISRGQSVRRCGSWNTRGWWSTPETPGAR